MTTLIPRLIRLRDAPCYLGMDKNRFNREVRPKLMNIPIGKQGIAFDRLEMDVWVEQYKHCNGRPTSEEGVQIWDANKRQGYENVKHLAHRETSAWPKTFRKHWHERPRKSGTNVSPPD